MNLFAVLVSVGLAIKVQDPSRRGTTRTCTPSCAPHCPQCARTGIPCLPVANVWPYKTNQSWSVHLAERVVMAAKPSSHVTEERCKGFKLFFDYAWCIAAFEGESSSQGLSFGIERRDPWSETMSNTFHMPTMLFDCFQDPNSSPPLALIAPNAAGSCEGNPNHCYETHYDAFRTCLGPREETVQGRNYTSLSNLLSKRGELSTHVKMDVEGSEWSVLEDLLENNGDMRKIRTLDMEVHFGFRAASEAARRKDSKEEQVTREVQIFEKLAQKFAVSGSRIEMNADYWQPAVDCAQQQCGEPVVHTNGGYPLHQFPISFVNPSLVQ